MVGLAVARELAMTGREVIIVERETLIGSITSSRNSEVIHAGIYYPAGSAKARLCVAGRRLLYEYCQSRNVPHERCGKFIVATSPEQVEKLENIRRSAVGNGADDLVLLSRDEALKMEPALHCLAAVHSPSTGIIDSHAYMQALLGDATAHGASLALQSTVIGAEVMTNGIRLTIDSPGSDPTELLAGTVINSAGLDAPAVASRIDGLQRHLVPRAHFAKGNYYSLSGRAPFKRLVYPVPEPGGLGVHLTIDLGGQAKFGPDVQWLDIADSKFIDYAVDPARAERFYAEIRKYWPGLANGALTPAYSGVRPKTSAPGADADFVIQGPATHGIPGLVNLFGIESPGLTSSLALAGEVCNLV